MLFTILPIGLKPILLLNWQSTHQQLVNGSLSSKQIQTQHGNDVNGHQNLMAHRENK